MRGFKLGDKVRIKQFPLPGADIGWIVDIKPNTPYPFYVHSKSDGSVNVPDMGPYSADQLEFAPIEAAA